MIVEDGMGSGVDSRGVIDEVFTIVGDRDGVRKIAGI